jgi:hypothetical protein
VLVRTRLCKLQKGCTRLTATSNKAYRLLAHSRWFSPETPASATTKTGRHDIEINILAAKNLKINNLACVPKKIKKLSGLTSRFNIIIAGNG